VLSAASSSLAFVPSSAVLSPPSAVAYNDAPRPLPARGAPHAQELEKPYIRTSSRATIKHVKRFLAKKLKLQSHEEVDPRPIVGPVHDSSISGPTLPTPTHAHLCTPCRAYRACHKKGGRVKMIG